MDRRDEKAAAVIAVVVVLWVLLFALRAVTPFDDVVDDPSGSLPATMQIGFLDSVDSLNPCNGYNSASFFYYGLVYDCLTSLDEDLKPTGNLAVDWRKVPTTDPAMIASGEPYGSVWEYNLSRNAYWHDGVQFTAEDVVYTFTVMERGMLWYDGYYPYSYFMNEVEAIDEFTVRIHFSDRGREESVPIAWGDFIPIPILPKHLVERLPWYLGWGIGQWNGVFSNDTSPGMPVVGTGPWIASPTIWEDWIREGYIELVKNPNYHLTTDKPGSPDVDIDKLVILSFRDSTSMVLALKHGVLDIAELPPTAYASIREDVQNGSLQNVTCFDGPRITNNCNGITFCMEDVGPNSSWLDPAVRHALHMATNKTYIVDKMYHGYAEEGTTFVSPVNAYWHYEPTVDELYSYDLAAASALLEANGYIDTDGNGYRDCTIASSAVQRGWVSEGTDMVYRMFVRKESPEQKDIAQFLKTQWEQIGVGLEYFAVEEITVAFAAHDHNYDTLIWHWSADVDPNFPLYAMARDGWYDWYGGDYNLFYDENYSNAAMTLDEAQRKVYVDNAQKMFYNDSVYIVLAYPDQTYAWRNDSIDGWGDWESHPGRSLDAYWGANPLFFDLESVKVRYEHESEPSSLSMGLNVLIGVAIVGTVVVSYVIWKRGSRTEQPPKME